MKRTVIKINENLCNGCGSCIKGCHEGALQLIDGKARIKNEAVCDGLGACIGECPMGAIEFEEDEVDTASQLSQLSQWPIQLHLINPQASYFINADVVLAADCSAYAFGNFHKRFLKNHSLAIACPKLDKEKESYIEKITFMIDVSNINTLTVIMMEVPCCGGLLQMARQAVDNAKRKIPIKIIIVGIKGNILKEE